MNSLSFQRVHWRKELAAFDWSSKKPFGYGWGDPESATGHLGNYLNVNRHLQSLIHAGATVMDVGCLGGKWLPFMSKAGKIICVDLNEESFRYIKHKFPAAPVEFYLTKGDELRGIPDNSVDVIFSMDTFVRVPKSCLRSYFMEFKRVLKKGGNAYVHLPNDKKPESIRRRFVGLSLEEAKAFCTRAGLEVVMIDGDSLTHGIMCQARNA